MIDALVAGAGPAGSIAAILLARAGARVALVDRSRFPRRKLCGDSINPGARAILRRLGLAEAVEPGGLPVRGMLVTGGGAAVVGEYPRGWSGISIERSVLDERLVRAAAAAGAEIEEGVLVTDAIREPGRNGDRIAGVRVRRRGPARAAIAARICIAADGRHSRLAFGLGLARHPPRPRRWAVGAYFGGVERVGDLGEMHVRPGHYLGVARVPGGLVNVCLVTADRARLRDPERALREAIASDPVLRERFARAVQAAPAVSLGPLAVAAGAAGMPGLLLAGDAAGFVDPMTGDGLRFAFRSGELAARAALLALERGRTDAHEVLARWRREFRAKRTFNRALRRIVDSPRAIRLTAAAARRAPDLLRGAIRVAGDVPAGGRP